MDYSQFGAMYPELLVLAVFIIIFLYDTFTNDGAAKKALTPLALILFGAMTVAMWFIPVNTTEIFGGMYVNTQVCVAIKGILNLGVFLVLLQGAHWVDSEEGVIRRGEFYELLLSTLFGMYLMISARHFLVFFIGLETASLPLAAMVAFQKRRYESHEAAVKYIMTAVFSSAVLLMGLSLMYGITALNPEFGGSLYFSDIAQAITSGEGSAMLIVAVAFIIAGFGFKLSLVPFHLWTADVYQGAPTVVTSYLSVISKGSAAFAFLVVLCQVFGQVYSNMWEWMMYGLIIATITIGNLFAIRQRNMKRFMAFSSVSQAGYIMLGIIAGSAQGLTAMLFYILVYIFSNLGAFAVISAIEKKTDKVGMDDYNGLHKTNPWLAFTMTLAMFSLAGIPPFAGFFSKFMIFVAATGTGTYAMYILVLIALINTIISLYYYLLVVKAMWINPDESVIETFKSTCTEKLGMWLCLAGILALGLVSCVYMQLDKVSEQASNLFATLG